MTREQYNKIAAATLSRQLGIRVHACLLTCADGIFISLYTDGNQAERFKNFPKMESVEFDEELNETYGYLRLS